MLTEATAGSAAAPPKAATARELLYARRCQVCSHPQRARIELAVAKGTSMRATARMFDVSEDALNRHWKRHTPEQVKAARLVSILKPGSNLSELVEGEQVDNLETLKLVRAALLWSLDQALQFQDKTTIATLSAQLNKNVQTVASLTGELIHRTQHVSTTLMLTPEYLQMRAALVRAVEPYPEAAVAVAAMLHKLEARPSTPTKVIEANAGVHA